MIHLHVHSNFSFLDGASPPDRLLRRARDLGMSALALTDHHGLYGVVRFIHAARAHGIKPIIGVEIRLRTEGPEAAVANPHLLLLAKDRVGYANLCRIVTRAQLDYQDDPQITLSDLAEHAGGLIALSGCRRGEIPSLLLSGDRAGAIEAVERYLAVFGQNFWIELEHHL